VSGERNGGEAWVSAVVATEAIGERRDLTRTSCVVPLWPASRLLLHCIVRAAVGTRERAPARPPGPPRSARPESPAPIPRPSTSRRPQSHARARQLRLQKTSPCWGRPDGHAAGRCRPPGATPRGRHHAVRRDGDPSGRRAIQRGEATNHVGVRSDVVTGDYERSGGTRASPKPMSFGECAVACSYRNLANSAPSPARAPTPLA
jgi:hypothetical protein